jgi:hypothetical protein
MIHSTLKYAIQRSEILSALGMIPHSFVLYKGASLGGV